MTSDGHPVSWTHNNFDVIDKALQCIVTRVQRDQIYRVLCIFVSHSHMDWRKDELKNTFVHFKSEQSCVKIMQSELYKTMSGEFFGEYCKKVTTKHCCQVVNLTQENF